ncbi:MAG: CRISPR-associated protein [Campylobacterales bacterium]|nr:CRISPR-associated protein [Campylobacterales bacterium]
MSDIIKIFAQIGTEYLEDEKRVKNKAYEYNTIKTYLFDIENKSIEPHFNISKDDLIICRFGIGANSGNLFPNQPVVPKEINSDIDKFIRGVIKANKNLLSFFSEEQIEDNPILKILMDIDEEFFTESAEQVKKLEAYKAEKAEKGKSSTYFSLSYKGKPISAYFQDVYEEHLQTDDESSQYGFDMLSNKKGIGGDANLAFCSVNDLPASLKAVKAKLLPLSLLNAKKVKIGFDVMDKMLSHNFYGLKMAIVPTLLSKDLSFYKEIFEILEKAAKGSISQIETNEISINEYLEEAAYSEKELPVLNTILFYNKSNAAVDVLLQIDDVLPSYITHVSDRMGFYGIKAFKKKDSKEEGIVYLQNLFDDRLEIMNLLLSNSKIDVDILLQKFSQLIYWGNINKKYAFAIDWSSFFNGNHFHRSMGAIKKYIALLNDINKLNPKLILQKECALDDVSGEKEKIRLLIQNSPFLQENDVLQTAYLLGMLSAALMNWQYGVSRSSSYNKWLNNSGAITKDTLERIWKKAEETIRKLNSTSGTGSATVNEIKELVVESSQKAFLHIGVVKSAYVSLAFAMGGSDYQKHIKDEKKSKEEK